MDKGITGTGEGFDAPSKGRLGAGGFGGHNPSPAQLRSKMVQVKGLQLLSRRKEEHTHLPNLNCNDLHAHLQAAEARASKQSIMPGGPRRLGGRQRALTPQQVVVWCLSRTFSVKAAAVDTAGLCCLQAAAEAAQRRAQDDVGCGCGAKSSTDLSEREVIILETSQDGAASSPQRVCVHQPAASFSVLRDGMCAGPEVSDRGGASAVVNKQPSLGGVGLAENTVGAADGAGNRPDVRRGGSYQTEDVVDLTADSDEDDVQQL